MQRQSNKRTNVYRAIICPIFSHPTFQNMLFWLLKDAQLACKRCPLSPLLTPFWSPTKHLLKRSFITYWFTNSYKLTFYTYFSPILGTLYLKYCNIFSTLSNDIKTRTKRAKQTFFDLLLPLFLHLRYGVSRILLPSPIGEGLGVRLLSYTFKTSGYLANHSPPFGGGVGGGAGCGWLAGWLIGFVVLFISPPTPSANVLSHHDTALPVRSRGLLLPASWG